MPPFDAAALAEALVARSSAPRQQAQAFADAAVQGLAEVGAPVTIDGAAFARHVASRAPGSELDGLHAADLAIAFACARGHRETLAWFDRAMLSQLRPAIARLVPASGGASAQVDDVLQMLRERLLVPDGSGRCRLEDFGGRGPLLAWLRAAAVRLALNSRRGLRVELSDDAALESAAASLDVETEILKGLHREQFTRAFQASLEGLSARDRMLLKLHFVDGMSLEPIGAMYGVNKSSVSRWLAAARGQLLEGTRDRLARELRLSPDEVRSLVRLIRSRVSLGLSGLLSPPSGSG